jgi:hypothetical protein
MMKHEIDTLLFAVRGRLHTCTQTRRALVRVHLNVLINVLILIHVLVLVSVCTCTRTHQEQVHNKKYCRQKFKIRTLTKLFYAVHL